MLRRVQAGRVSGIIPQLPPAEGPQIQVWKGSPGQRPTMRRAAGNQPKLLSTTLPQKCLQMVIVLLILSSSDSASMLPPLDLTPMVTPCPPSLPLAPGPAVYPQLTLSPRPSRATQSPIFPSCEVGVKVIPARRLEARMGSGARMLQAGPGVRNNSCPHSPLPVPITNQIQTKPALSVQSLLQADGRAREASPRPPQPGRTPRSARASWVGSQESLCISTSHCRTEERVSWFLGQESWAWPEAGCGWSQHLALGTAPALTLSTST